MRRWHEVLSLIRRPRHDAAIDACFYERRVTVALSEYRYRVFAPPGWSKAGRWPVILSLHGGGGYGSDGIRQTGEGLAPAICRHPERFPALAVFPQSPPPERWVNRTPGWQGVGGQIALAALGKTIEEFNGDESRVALTGLSIGGNGAWYLAYHHPQRFARLLVVCGFVAERIGTMHPVLYPSVVPGSADPTAALAQRLALIPTWIVHGDADTTVPVEQSRRMAAALTALGAPVRYTELPKVGHNAWDCTYDRPDVANWLVQQPTTTSAK